jgi:hypothetical protein
MRVSCSNSTARRIKTQTVLHDVASIIVRFAKFVVRV